MSDADFKELLAELEAASFKDSKMGVVRMAAKHNHFTCDQARQLVEAMPFRDLELETAVLLYPRIVDPQRFHKVMGALTFENDRRELESRLGL